MERKIILSCPTLKKELEKAVEEAGFAGEVCFIPQSLHSSPKELRKYLQDMIDRMEGMEEIFLCVSGCGGATAGLRAAGASLIVPKTRDCADILLSGDSLEELKRPKDGFFLSYGWMEYMKNSRLDLNRILKEKGPENSGRIWNSKEIGGRKERWGFPGSSERKNCQRSSEKRGQYFLTIMMNLCYNGAIKGVIL